MTARCKRFVIAQGEFAAHKADMNWWQRLKAWWNRPTPQQQMDKLFAEACAPCEWLDKEIAMRRARAPDELLIRFDNQQIFFLARQLSEMFPPQKKRKKKAANITAEQLRERILARELSRTKTPAKK